MTALLIKVGGQLPLYVARAHVVRAAVVDHKLYTAVVLVEFLGPPTPLHPDNYWVYRLTAGRGLPDDVAGVFNRFDPALQLVGELGQYLD